MIEYSNSNRSLISYPTIPATIFQMNELGEDGSIVESKVYINGKDESEYFDSLEDLSDSNAQRKLLAAMANGLEFEFTDYCTYSCAIIIDLQDSYHSTMQRLYSLGKDDLAEFLVLSENSELAETFLGLVEFEKKFISMFGGSVGQIGYAIYQCPVSDRLKFFPQNCDNASYEIVQSWFENVSENIFDGDVTIELPHAKISLVVTLNESDLEKFNALCELIDAK